MTEPEPLQQVDRTYVRFHQRKFSCFSGCDYFRLASHPRVIAAFSPAEEIRAERRRLPNDDGQPRSLPRIGN